MSRPPSPESCDCKGPCLSLQGFEGTLVWESLDSAGLSTVDSSSVQLSDGGGVLKISSVRSDTVGKRSTKKKTRLKRERIIFFSSFLCFQFADGKLPHRSALGFPGLAGGFTFTIYGQSCGKIVCASYFYQDLWVHGWNKRRVDPWLNVKTLPVSHSARLWDQLLIFLPWGLVHQGWLEIMPVF